MTRGGGARHVAGSAAAALPATRVCYISDIYPRYSSHSGSDRRSGPRRRKGPAGPSGPSAGPPTGSAGRGASEGRRRGTPCGGIGRGLTPGSAGVCYSADIYPRYSSHSRSDRRSGPLRGRLRCGAVRVRSGVGARRGGAQRSRRREGSSRRSPRSRVQSALPVTRIPSRHSDSVESTHRSQQGFSSQASCHIHPNEQNGQAGGGA